MILNIIILIILSLFIHGASQFTIKAIRGRCISGVVMYSMSYLSCIYMMVYVISKILE